MSGLHSPKLELPTKLLSGSLISWRFSCSKILTFSMVDLPIQHFSFYFILLVKLYKSKCCPLNSDVFVPVKNTCCYLDPTFWPLNFIISFASSSSTVDSSKHQKGKQIHHTFTIGLNAMLNASFCCAAQNRGIWRQRFPVARMP